MDLKLFQNPSSEYRAVPFWSWNDRLEDGELRRQIALMQEGGWGGFFMHARVGLETPYLTPEWFDRVRAAVDEAKRRGMQAWLYDEDKWPSGFAGGLSVASNPDYRMKTLVCKPDNKPALVKERLRAFLARQVDGRLADFRPVRGEEDLIGVRWGEEWLVQFYPHTVPLGAEWFNDYTYLDTLNPEAVQAFIQTTHEAYARAVGEEFGQTIPGIFTDEPCFQVGNASGGPIRLPWTDGFPAYFAQQNGYDLLDHLPALVYDTPESPAIRYDYWRTVIRRFLESWGKPIYDWCEAHNLAFTGHYMAEDTLLSQISWIGAAMPCYEYMQIPGIDKLERHIDQPITAKQVDSVACQLGRKRVLCEAYGCAGQDLNFVQRKWIGDHLYVLGVNLLNPHLSLYSMRGARKRDCPANLFYQQPWWPENRLLDDYFARLSYALSQGQRVVDVLVIHPIASAWTVYSPIATHRVRELDQQLRGLNDDLLALHRDYHFGDEMLMERYARISESTKGEDGPVLRVGEMSYRVVIVPPGVTLARHTVELLNRFAAAGGSVIAIEPTPTLIDGRPAAAVLPAATAIIPAEREALRTALDKALPPAVVIADAPGVLYHHRRLEDGDLFFLANTDLEEEVVTRVRLPGCGRLERWDALNGRVEPLAGQMADGVTEVVLTFPPAGSHLLLLRAAGKGVAATQAPAPLSVVARYRLADEWQFERRDPNALTLDYCRYWLGEDDWSEPGPVWKAHQAVRDLGGVGAPFALRFHFDVAELPRGPLTLVVEKPEQFRITVNGQAVQPGEGYWRDIGFRCVDITGAARAGRNQIVLESVFRTGMELESLYLIGDFAVTAGYIGQAGRRHGQTFNYFRGPFTLVAEPQSLTGGDLARQGYPFFAGRILLRQTVTLADVGGRSFLEFDDPHAIVLKVRVNGHQAEPLILPPYRVEVTGALRAGANEVEIEMVSSLRNLLGPHHLRGGDPDGVGPESFANEALWTDDYTLVPFGLGRVSLVQCQSGLVSPPVTG